VELRHLRYFVAVAETLHFGRAAQRLGVTQPSLSHQIRQLEAEIGTALFARTSRRTELTEAGRLFLDEAREILARTDRAAVLVRRLGHPEGGHLQVGIGVAMTIRPLLAAVAAVARQGQKTGVDVQTMPVTAQIAALLDGRLDVAFVRPPVSEPGLSSDLVAREPLCVALPRSHPEARRSVIRLSLLAADSFVLVSREIVPVYHDLVLQACREAGFVPNAPYEADHLALILRMAAVTHSVALVPASAKQYLPRSLVLRRLAPARTLDIAVAWRQEHASPVVDQYLGAVRAGVGRLRNRGQRRV
jgi:DNA-binding transcriptional LysR family regulator